MTAKKKIPAAKKIATPRASGKSLEEFRSAHDKSYIVPKKIKDALAKLGDSWEYEVDFVKTANISITDLIPFRDQFEGHIVAVKANGSSHKKNVWAGTLAFAAKLRELAS
jgi:hypothetical protein